MRFLYKNFFYTQSLNKMETRIVDLKPTDKRRVATKVARPRFNWCDVLYVLVSVAVANKLPLHGHPRFLPSILNEKSVKLALASAIVFFIAKQFTNIFLTNDDVGV